MQPRLRDRHRLARYPERRWLGGAGASRRSSWFAAERLDGLLEGKLADFEAPVEDAALDTVLVGTLSAFAKLLELTAALQQVQPAARGKAALVERLFKTFLMRLPASARLTCRVPRPAPWLRARC